MRRLAHILIKKDPQYRAVAFATGLEHAGYLVDWREPRMAQPGNVIVMWNRSGLDEIRADRYEKQGFKVIIAENGYIGTDSDGIQCYALALHGHNGSGFWPDGDESRWPLLNIPIKPWRRDGDHILLCPNRFIGSKLMRQPVDFTKETVWNLKQYTSRPIKVRPHPGNWQVKPPKIPLTDDLRNAWACVIWSSSAGVRALVGGIPVFALAPHWICLACADTSLSRIDNPSLPDRKPVLERLAWAQWTIREIAQGIPFKCLQQI